VSGGWKGSDRKARLPSNWASEIRPAAHARNPDHICHICGQPGGDYLDHKTPGDDHSLDNLDWAHDLPPLQEQSRRAGGQAQQSPART
jgi:5-methylcytosine-specific restriction protein A